MKERQIADRRWTVRGRGLKVIMNNSDRNGYKNTPSGPFTTDPRRQQSNWHDTARDLLGDPHYWFWNNFPPCTQEIKDNQWGNSRKGGGRSLVADRIHKEKPLSPGVSYRLKNASELIKGDMHVYLLTLSIHTSQWTDASLPYISHFSEHLLSRTIFSLDRTGRNSRKSRESGTN